MKKLVSSLVALVVLIFVAGTVYLSAQPKPAAPAASADSDSSGPDPEIQHIFMCELCEGTTEEQVDEIVEHKLKAIRQMPGGEKAQLNVLWPVAVSFPREIDFAVVVTFPSSTEWGKFWDAYEDASPLARADDKMAGKVECPDSMMLESHAIEAAK